MEVHVNAFSSWQLSFLCIQHTHTHKMAEPIHTPAVEREPPSLPASPSPKRVKHVEPAPNLSVACQFAIQPPRIARLKHTNGPTAILNDTAATPTPQSPPTMSAPAANVSLPSMSLEPPPPPLQIKLLSDKGRAPTRGSAFAAGYDIYSAQSTTVPARGKVLVETDISIAVPAGTCTMPLPS